MNGTARTFTVPAWIVDTLGTERTRQIARATMRDLKAAGIGPARGIPTLLDVLAVEADGAQRRAAGIV